MHVGKEWATLLSCCSATFPAAEEEEEVYIQCLDQTRSDQYVRIQRGQRSYFAFSSITRQFSGVWKVGPGAGRTSSGLQFVHLLQKFGSSIYSRY